MNKKLFFIFVLICPMIFSMHNDDYSNLPNKSIATPALKLMYEHPFISSWLFLKLFPRKIMQVIEVYNPQIPADGRPIKFNSNLNFKRYIKAANIALAIGFLGMGIKSLTHYKLVEDNISHSHPGLLFKHAWLKNQKCIEHQEDKPELLFAINFASKG